MLFRSRAADRVRERHDGRGVEGDGDDTVPAGAADGEGVVPAEEDGAGDGGTFREDGIRGRLRHPLAVEEAAGIGADFAGDTERARLEAPRRGERGVVHDVESERRRRGWRFRRRGAGEQEHGSGVARL